MIFLYVGTALLVITLVLIVRNRIADELKEEYEIRNTPTEEFEKRLEALEEIHQENTMKTFNIMSNKDKMLFENASHYGDIKTCDKLLKAYQK